MFFSVENRSPFLDKELFEFASQIPTQHLIQRGYAKVVLRDAMKGLVPEEVLYSRRKVGFNAPIFSFLDPHQPTVRAELLNDSPIFNWVKRESIVNLLDQKDLGNSESLFLFYFLNAKIFLEEFGQ
jgi:asparagine synthase (glutamine-hydrolysing)